MTYGYFGHSVTFSLFTGQPSPFTDTLAHCRDYCVCVHWRKSDSPFGGSTSLEESTEEKAQGLLGASVREELWVKRVRKEF